MGGAEEEFGCEKRVTLRQDLGGTSPLKHIALLQQISVECLCLGEFCTYGGLGGGPATVYV